MRPDPASRGACFGPKALRVLVMALVLGAALMALSTPSAAADGDHADIDVPDGWMLYDGGSLVDPTGIEGLMPVELAIDYFAPGLPPVRWSTISAPVIPFCTRQAGRPAWVSAEEFREAVRLGARAWAVAGAAIGIAYAGDCEAGMAWQLENGVNEVGWDDSRRVVQSPAAAITSGSWSSSSRRFFETDIVLHRDLDAPLACLNSVVAHELGHALGLGHSSTPGHLMYPSFNPRDVATCPGTPVPEESAIVQQLYGVDAAPVVIQPATQTVIAGAQSSVSISAGDPEGGPLTYSWTQVAGPAVTLTGANASASFVAPSQPGATLEFRVTVRDMYLHEASATVRAQVTEAGETPTQAPVLDTFSLSPDGRRMALVFSPVPRATEYRVCTRPQGTSLNACQVLSTPVVEVTWDLVLGAAVEDEPRRVFTGGIREVSVQGCNPRGCSPASEGNPMAGGLRWAAHEIDFDYFAMAFDVPGSQERFSIALVQNVSETPRNFQLYAGVEDDYRRELMLDCGAVPAGDVCLGFLAPEDADHGTHVTVTSRRGGTPETEHRIRIR